MNIVLDILNIFNLYNFYICIYSSKKIYFPNELHDKYIISFNYYKVLNINKLYKNIIKVYYPDLIIFSYIDFNNSVQFLSRYNIPILTNFDKNILGLPGEYLISLILYSTHIFFLDKHIMEVISNKYPNFIFYDNENSIYITKTIQFNKYQYFNLNYLKQKKYIYYINNILLSYISKLNKILKIYNNSLEILSQTPMIDYNFAFGEKNPTKKRLNELFKIYISKWRYSFRRNKLISGFNPGIYSELRNIKYWQEPFTDYIKNNTPSGKWLNPVLTVKNPLTPKAITTSKIAIHIHAYHLDLLFEIFNRLSFNKNIPDIYISTRDNINAEIIYKYAKFYNIKINEIKSVENRGRNFYPLINIFGDHLVDNYNYICHVHTKKSMHLPIALGFKWSNFIYESILGGSKSGAIIDTIQSLLIKNSSIGLIYPEDPRIYSWDHNKKEAMNLANRLGINSLPDNFNFPVGSMCWMKKEVLREILNLKLSFNDYPMEPIGTNLTILHALERFIGLLPDILGYKTLTIKIVDNLPSFPK
jgi:hypothetical protein